MIFEQVKLNNFGIYQGEHTVDLNVTDHTKPVVLFGGLNGGGKTTFLDSLQLALYGKNAKCSNRGKLSYSDYLKQTVNRYSEKKFASVALSFRHTQRTQTKRYEVIRSWEAVTNKEITDKVQVLVNGELDKLLTDNWNDFVSEFIPQSMSALFFFDGEKIEDLADPLRSAQLLKTGIESLLGLELFTQLSKDLNSQKRRRQEKNLESSARKRVEELNTRKEKLENNLCSIEKLEHDALKKQEKISNKKETIALKMQISGANLIDELSEIKREQDCVNRQIEAIDHNLVKIAANTLPFALAPSLFMETRKQASLEAESKNFKIAQGYIEKQNENLLARLATTVDKETIDSIDMQLKSINTELTESLKLKSYLNINPEQFRLANEILSTAKVECYEYLSEKQRLIEKSALLEKKIGTIPDVKLVKPQLKYKDKLDIASNMNKLHLDALAEDLIHCKSQINENEARLDATLILQNAEDFEGKRNKQVVDHLAEIKSIVDAFKASLIKENITTLEKRIKSKFDSLERKSELVAKVKINPETFNLTLLGLDGLVLDTKRLSAGERQLLSVAILWALAESSGKEIPTIIDTPMGRLDGKHRTKLVENYFPEAAGQVILLSTDEEIAGQYYKKLKHSVAKEYHISYEETAKTSTITEGYFGESA